MSEPMEILEFKAAAFDAILENGLSLTICVGDTEATISREQEGGVWLTEGEGFRSALLAICTALTSRDCESLTINGVTFRPNIEPRIIREIDLN